MSPIRDQSELDAMRKRLYDRTGTNTPFERSGLSDITPVVPNTWQAPPVTPVPAPVPVEESVPPVAVPKKKHWSYRSLVLLVATGFFTVVLSVTGLYLYFGNNQISNKNIDLTITGPLTTGGGQVANLEVLVNNNNSVPIEGGVLIINLPPGTKSSDESARDLLEERISIGTVAPGESYKAPLSVVMFGEENQERQVKATIEYRVVGSSGTFYKEAEPLTFTIISSPVVIRVDALKKVSAGQEIDVTLEIKSNTETPLRNILVTADYPSNFDYSSAVPAPSYRESAWTIDELKPEQTKTIKIKGVIVGKQSEEFQMKFAVGTPEPTNQFAIGSVLANTAT
ncbi:MAG: hypothetical protein RLZZ70_337, partial [Candidatus Parcubacteria bacterium]